jgi:hypothetical protein
VVKVNEKEQNKTLDYYINKCPLFNQYLDKFHNVIVYKGQNQLCEIDDLYVFYDFYLIGENKTRNTAGCYKKMNAQIKRFKRYENFIRDKLCLFGKAYYFYAHFENDLLHVEYEGVK